MDKRSVSARHCSAIGNTAPIAHRLPSWRFQLTVVVLGKDFQAKGAAGAKALRSLVLGMFRAVSWLAGMLQLVDKGRQQGGGGAIRGLWGDRAGGADATGCPCPCRFSAPRCDACQRLLTCRVPSEVFSGHRSKPGVQQSSPEEPESRLTHLHLAESPRAQKALSPRQTRMGVTSWRS